MRLVELFLRETSDEDRALISLSSAIYKYVQRFSSEEDNYDNADDAESQILRIGKIGQLFDTPVEALRGVNLELMPDDAIANRLKKEVTDDSVIRHPSTNDLLGIWMGDSRSIVLNSDYLSTNYLKTAITHELRHALDDIKSGFKAAGSDSYSTPKNKAHRTDPDTKYIAEPAEINARFLEVLHNMVPAIKRYVKLTHTNARNFAIEELYKQFDRHRIAELFPERTESRDYRRLMRRAVEFIDKEIKHQKSQLPDEE